MTRLRFVSRALRTLTGLCQDARVLALRLFAKLTAYYVAVTAAVLLALYAFPNLRAFMPFGGVEALMSNPRTGIESMFAPNAVEVGNLRETLYWLSITILGALLTALPSSWVYISVRSSKDYDQSLVDTIVVLPIVVTSRPGVDGGEFADRPGAWTGRLGETGFRSLHGRNGDFSRLRRIFTPYHKGLSAARPDGSL